MHWNHNTVVRIGCFGNRIDEWINIVMFINLYVHDQIWTEHQINFVEKRKLFEIWCLKIMKQQIRSIWLYFCFMLFNSEDNYLKQIVSSETMHSVRNRWWQRSELLSGLEVQTANWQVDSDVIRGSVSSIVMKVYTTVQITRMFFKFDLRLTQ